jgi:tetratricopeptide (TPR) repeat protein
VVPAAIVVLALVLALVFKPWKVEISPTQEAVAGEDRLAVMYFDNLVDPKDEARLGEIVTNLLITALSQTKDLNVLSSQRLYDILKQSGQEETHSVDRETASQVARKANAKWMLTGTILQAEPRLVITAQVIDVATGQVEASSRSTGEEGEDIFSQIDRLAAEFRGEILGPGLKGAAPERSLVEMTTHSQEAYRYYLQGLDQLKKLYGIEAKKSLEKAVAIDSEFVMAHFWLANGFPQSADGEEHLRQAMKYSYKASETQRLYIISLADYYAADYDGAIAGLKQVIEREPDNKDAYLSLAYVYDREKNQPDSAIRYLEKVLEFDPKAKAILNSIAYLYKDLRQVDRGLEYIDRYITIVPDEPNPYDSQGELYASKGDFQLAIASYRKALAIDPGFESALQALATIAMLQGDRELADSCARALIAQPEEGVRALGRTLLAQGAANQGQFNQALQLLDQGIAADRMENIEDFDYLDKFAIRSLILTHLERWQEAATAMKQAVNQGKRLRPDDPFTFEDVYAVALARVGDTAAALDLLDLLEHRLTSMGGTNADRAWVRIAQGRVSLLQGHTGDAIRNLEAAVPLNRRNLRPIAEHYLAEAYLEAGRPADAVPLLKRQLTNLETIDFWLPVDFAEANFMLGQAYEGTGKTRKAVEQYRRVLEMYENGDPDIPLRDKARQRLEQIQA